VDQILPLIDPRKTLFQIPCMTGQIEAGCAGGLISSAAAGLLGYIGFLVGNSNISSARSKIANDFLRSQLEWIVWIDADIQFTPNDLRYLMSIEPDGEFGGQKVEYTRTEVTATDGQVHGAELAVTAEYSKKNDEQEPVRFGMGFVRLHRSVFERLANLTTGDGGEAIGKYMDEGRICSHFFPSSTSSDSRLMPEDTSFWNMVALAGIVPRIETRTNLIHWGRKPYPYRNSLISG
jgi:hypothetical protein